MAIASAMSSSAGEAKPARTMPSIFVYLVYEIEFIHKEYTPYLLAAHRAYLLLDFLFDLAFKQPPHERERRVEDVVGIGDVEIAGDFFALDLDFKHELVALPLLLDNFRLLHDLPAILVEHRVHAAARL